MAFTTENFINISSNNTNGRANALQPVSLRPGDWNWRILLRTLPAPNEEVELYAEDIPIPNSDIWPIQ
jgi:hypothetical protein